MISNCEAFIFHGKRVWFPSTLLFFVPILPRVSEKDEYMIQLKIIEYIY